MTKTATTAALLFQKRLELEMNEFKVIIDVRTSIKRSYLELEVADIGLGVNERDESAELAEVGMTLEEMMIGGSVNRKIGLLLLAVEEKVKVVVMMVLLLGLILVTVG